MQTKTLYLREIVPYENNPRKNDKAVDAVAESIRQCGYIAPVIVDENNVILAGHTRLKALETLGYDKIPVIEAKGLTEEQKRKYRLLDNKTAELAEWDFALLAEELDGLDFGALDFDWGLSEEMEDDPIEDSYEEAVPEQPKAKPGEIYLLGRHRLMCGDSTDKEDVKRLMNGQKADLLLTDPPYNVGLGQGESKRTKTICRKRKDGKTLLNDNMEDGDFRIFLSTVFKHAKEEMKAGACFYIWHADGEGYTFRGAAMDAGFQIRQTLIWEKQSFVMGRQDYQWIHEPCLYGWNDGSHAWYSDRKQSTVLHFDRPVKSKEHPTMKPVRLFDYVMQNCTKAGDIVLDLFAGSGTTAIAAEQNGRNAYCMELDPRYVDVIIDRWERLTGQKAKKEA